MLLHLDTTMHTHMVCMAIWHMEQPTCSLEYRGNFSVKKQVADLGSLLSSRKPISTFKTVPSLFPATFEYVCILDV